MPTAPRVGFGAYVCYHSVTNLGRRIRPTTARVSQLPDSQRRTVPAIGRKADRVVVIFSNDRFGVLGRLISIHQRSFITDVSAISGAWVHSGRWVRYGDLLHGLAELLNIVSVGCSGERTYFYLHEDYCHGSG